jgi:hypothetical protein
MTLPIASRLSPQAMRPNTPYGHSLLSPKSNYAHWPKPPVFSLPRPTVKSYMICARSFWIEMVASAVFCAGTAIPLSNWWQSYILPQKEAR